MNWLQRHWDARAAANFMLGGAGSGLMVAALFVAEPAVPVVLSLVLIASGLTAVWLETGRKLRALHVFFNPFTSWMTRESFAPCSSSRSESVRSSCPQRCPSPPPRRRHSWIARRASCAPPRGFRPGARPRWCRSSS
jgi:hypothetical protein